MYAEVKGVRGRALGARAQGGGDKQEGTASEVVLHWRARAPPFGVAVGSFSFTEIAVGSFSLTEILKSTADVQHNARARMVPGPPSTGVAIAMDGGMAVSLRQTRARRARFYVHVHVQSTSRQVLLAGHGWSVPCVSIQAFNLKFSCVSIQAFNLKFSCRSGRGPVSPDTPETSKKQTPKFLLTISASFR